MADQISISKTLSIRDCGFDEYWLQNEIGKNPSILGLGDLEVVRREKQQSSGGKLDFLLEDPASDEMYEAEVMLGATDESHIIRALEYWDLERHRWPKRSHTAVLVAEKINRRFFNVIQLLSQTIPVIAIQVKIVEVGGKRVLDFTTILDAYQEPECEGREKSSAKSAKFGENYWQANSPAMWDVVQTLFNDVTAKLFPKINFQFKKSSVSLLANRYYVFTVEPKNQHSVIKFWIASGDAGSRLLKLNKIQFNRKPFREAGSEKQWEFSLEADNTCVRSHLDLFRGIAELVKKDFD
jgi:hypothetical protein